MTIAGRDKKRTMWLKTCLVFVGISVSAAVPGCSAGFGPVLTETDTLVSIDGAPLPVTDVGDQTQQVIGGSILLIGDDSAKRTMTLRGTGASAGLSTAQLGYYTVTQVGGFMIFHPYTIGEAVDSATLSAFQLTLRQHRVVNGSAIVQSLVYSRPR